MNYYLISFSASMSDYDSSPLIPMQNTLVMADSFSKACDKIRKAYSSLCLFDFTDLTIR